MTNAQHTHHPDSHEHGLADGCPRCTEHAENPLSSLDNRNLQALVTRTLGHRFGIGAGHLAPITQFAPRSDNEAVAMANVMTALEQTGKLFDVEPRLVARYLDERWHLDWPLAWLLAES